MDIMDNALMEPGANSSDNRQSNSGFGKGAVGEFGVGVWVEVGDDLGAEVEAGGEGVSLIGASDDGD